MGADTSPVARLGAPMHRVERIVLEGASGRTLVTCWPFDVIAPVGPLRYVVAASRCSPASNIPGCQLAEL